MLISQRLELETDRDLSRVFTRNAIAARIAGNDLVVAWRECGERLRCPGSLVGWSVPHLLKASSAKQVRPTV